MRYSVQADEFQDQLGITVSREGLDGLFHAISREVVNLKEQAVKDMLQRLGWTPPNENSSDPVGPHFPYTSEEEKQKSEWMENEIKRLKDEKQELRERLKMRKTEVKELQKALALKNNILKSK